MIKVSNSGKKSRRDRLEAPLAGTVATRLEADEIVAPRRAASPREFTGLSIIAPTRAGRLARSCAPELRTVASPSVKPTETVSVGPPRRMARKVFLVPARSGALRALNSASLLGVIGAGGGTSSQSRRSSAIRWMSLPGPWRAPSGDDRNDCAWPRCELIASCEGAGHRVSLIAPFRAHRQRRC